MKQLAIFDIDGTVCDTYDVDARCYVSAVSTVLQLDPVEVDWSQAPHITDSGILEWLCATNGKHLSEQAEAAIIDRFVALLESECRNSAVAFSSIDGAVEMIRRLPSQGWDVVFATGGWRPSAAFKLSRVGIAANEHVVITASDAKTRESIVETALATAEQRISARYDRVVSIGDGVWDVSTAAKLGLPFLGIGRGARADKLYRAGAELVIPDFVDQAAFLHALDIAPVPRPVLDSV